MRTIEITTPENVQVTYTLAGPGSRFLATLVDGCVKILILIPVGLALSAAGLWPDSLEALGPWVIAVALAAVLLVFEGYYLLFETLWNGQTPGKRAQSLRVLRDQGLPVDFRSVLLRNVLRVVDFLPIFYGIGGLMAIINPQGKRLGDLVAGTFVVIERPTAARMVEPPRGAAPADRPLALDLSMIDLSALSDEDWQAVQAFLDREAELEPPTRARLAAGISGPLMQKLGLPPAAAQHRHGALLRALADEMARRIDV